MSDRKKRAPIVTALPRRTVSDVLECLEDEFVDFAAAFARGQYLLWLGSGISRGGVPDVPGLLERLLEGLRGSIHLGNPAFKFRAALGEVPEVAGRKLHTRPTAAFASPAT